VITNLRRVGGRRWLAALLVSCVLALVAGTQLAALGGERNGQLSSQADTSALTQDPAAQPSTTSPAASDAVQSPDQHQSAGRPKRAAVKTRAEPDQPGRPKTLSIPRLGLKMPITSVTVDSTGAMAVPSSPTEVGWYAYGPRPGSAHGSAVLGGHVDTREHGVGPLVGLQQLHPGDEVVIATDKGAERFRVSTVKSISKRDLDVAEVFDRGGDPLLRIITCGGTFRRSQRSYQDNVVVTALPR
jgi:sortase (surface protein transpeptidase)